MKKLRFCLMRLPLADPDDYRSVDIEAVKLLVDEFMSKGFTYFDTAASYHAGNSEVVFREAVAKRYPRSAYTITDKLHLLMLKNPEDMQGIFSEQMERLGLDYVDYYWLHDLGEHSYHQAEAFHAFEFVQQLKMEYVQLQLNYFDWDSNSVQAKACYETVVRHGKQVVVMEPVKGGSLVQVPMEVEQMFRQKQPVLSNASWAIRFAASLDHVLVVLSGMSNLEQVEDNTSYMENLISLDQEEQEIVQKAVTMIRGQREVDCIDCGKCA